MLVNNYLRNWDKLYVKPEMRHRGIASLFLREAAQIADRIGVAGLYIDCLAVTAPVYEKNGWAIYEREVGDKDSVVMLRVRGKGSPWAGTME